MNELEQLVEELAQYFECKIADDTQDMPIFEIEGHFYPFDKIDEAKLFLEGLLLSARIMVAKKAVNEMLQGEHDNGKS